jgi:N-acetylglucosamine kinase-like BadF-type ATPase
MEFFLGIDGGGTGTRAILVNRLGCVLGLGESGPSNYHNVGTEVAGKNLKTAVDLAKEEANLSGETPSSVFIGCAGVRSKSDQATVRDCAVAVGLRGPRDEDLVVCNDLHNALSGGLGGRHGIALIAGTGSNCLGRDESGQTFMCGGWGWLMDDVGSGCGLAVDAMRTAVQMADGRKERTKLLQVVMRFFGANEASELLKILYTQSWPPEALGELAPEITGLAAEGDPGAIGVLRRGAAGLAALVATTRRQLAFGAEVDVVLLGSAALSGMPYQSLVESSIAQQCDGVRFVRAACSPLEGAALNALRMAGISGPKISYLNF